MTASFTGPADQHPATDPDFLGFIEARLVDERSAATDRVSTSGVELLVELLDGLEHGRAPDQMTCDLLVVAYAGHPDFRPEWNRWRRAADAPAPVTD